ncbi:MAG: hypothetical protein C4576_30535 [Desulfobacteraceae bacterium]|nr:MAG: hypothetical protein C4576_30535 [Desulfobacteraceae bacterium]
MKKAIVAALALFTALVFPGAALAQIMLGDKEVLLGLDTVSVVVERFKPEIERDGLYAATIQTDAEMKLRMAGMKVLESDDPSLPEDLPHLVIQVNALKYSEGYMYDARVFLREPVFLPRKKSRISGTTLRIRGQFGCTSHLSDIREEARDAVDNFIRVWQEANSKNP